MLENEVSEQNRHDDLLFSIALCLVVAVVLIIVAAIVTSGRFSAPETVSTRDRIELISEGSATIVTASLILASVAALTFLAAERAARARPLVVIALIVATALALLAVFTIVNILTIHVPSPNSNDTFSITLARGESISDRLGAVLPAIGTVFIALVAMVGANRAGNFVSGSRETSDDPQDLWEDE